MANTILENKTTKQVLMTFSGITHKIYFNDSPVFKGLLLKLHHFSIYVLSLQLWLKCSILIGYLSRNAKPLIYLSIFQRCVKEQEVEFMQHFQAFVLHIATVWQLMYNYALKGVF